MMKGFLCAGARSTVGAGLGLSLLLGACAPDASPPQDTETRASALIGGPVLLATSSIDRATDFAGLTDPMENGLPQNVLGGIGSGLAWAGGTTFLGVPDRGPNATMYDGGFPIDNTASFISRFEVLDLALTTASAGPLPLTLTPTLLATTLFSSTTPLIYGATPGLPSAVPAANGPGRFYFTGRSDNFGSGNSTDPSFARLDPEAIRVSHDGNTVFVADEYGPYIYQFDRLTGRRVRDFRLPDRFAITHLSGQGTVEIMTNTMGRVTNKGVEGLAITPDGSKLVALVQSPLIQDGGDGGRANRIVVIDIASGELHDYVYDNRIGTKNFNSSEIVALNDHQFLIDTRDGKGLGDGSVAVIKQLWAVDISGATPVDTLSTEAVLVPLAVKKTLFLDMVGVLNANNIPSTQIPAKIEGLAIGRDVVVGGVTMHTLFVGNDNDFIPSMAGPSRWFVFGFTDADLAAKGLSFTPQDLLERGPDLALTKTAGAATVTTGAPVAYTLTVKNNGLVPAASVQLSDLLPAQLTFTGCASTGTCGSDSSGQTVAFAGLAAGETQTATINTTVSCAVADGTVIVNNAAAAFALTDPTPADNASSASITALNPAPTIANLAVDQPTLWPPDKRMVTVAVGYGVSDNCPGTTCALSVSANEGSAADWTVVDAHTVTLRADRLGNGPGRTYTIAATCQDSGGAVSTSTTTVVVPHNQ